MKDGLRGRRRTKERIKGGQKELLNERRKGNGNNGGQKKAGKKIHNGAGLKKKMGEGKRKRKK